MLATATQVINKDDLTKYNACYISWPATSKATLHKFLQYEQKFTATISAKEVAFMFKSE